MVRALCVAFLRGDVRKTMRFSSKKRDGEREREKRRRYSGVIKNSLAPASEVASGNLHLIPGTPALLCHAALTYFKRCPERHTNWINQAHTRRTLSTTHFSACLNSGIKPSLYHFMRCPHTCNITRSLSVWLFTCGSPVYGLRWSVYKTTIFFIGLEKRVFCNGRSFWLVGCSLFGNCIDLIKGLLTINF